MKSPTEKSSSDTNLVELRTILNENLQNYGLSGNYVKVGSSWDQLEKDDENNTTENGMALN